MKILAIEFSTDERSVAVLEDGRCRGAARETATRETRAFGLIAAVLAAAGWEREAVEVIALGLGPGSYTGIRSAIALAQGWQLAGTGAGVQLLGIGSVECVAVEAWKQGWFGPVNVVVDAQRREVYLAGYEIGPAGCREIRPLKLASVEEAGVFAAAGELMVGPEVERWFKAGRTLFPSAATLGSLAAGRTDYVPGEKLEPVYLRAPAFVKAPPPRVLPADLRACNTSEPS